MDWLVLLVDIEVLLDVEEVEVLLLVDVELVEIDVEILVDCDVLEVDIEVD